MERRSVLRGLLGAGGSATLAGCFGDGGDESPTERGDGSTSTASASATNSPSPTGTDQQPGPSDNVVVVPPDGDLNGTLSKLVGQPRGRAPYGVVKLQANETYEVSEPIQLPPVTQLHGNGARIVPTGDVDVIHMAHSTHLKNLIVDAENTDGWESTGITVHSRQGRPGGPKWVEVRDVLLMGPNPASVSDKVGTGVAIADRNGNGMSNVSVHANVQKMGVGVHFRAEGEDAWCNGNWFRGRIRGAGTCILMDASPASQPVSGNIVDAGIQPHSTSWIWDLQTGKHNLVRAMAWDPQYLTEDGNIWRIGENVLKDNVLVDMKGRYSWEDHVVEKKYGGVPNGAAGNTLFDWSKAHAQRDLTRAVDDNSTAIQELREQVESLSTE